MKPEPVIELRHARRPLVQGERAVWRDEPAHGYTRPTRPYMQDRSSIPTYTQDPPAIHRARRGFKRYEAALSARWGEAVDRVRHQRDHPLETPPRTVEYRLYSRQEPPHQDQVQVPSPGHVYYLGDVQNSPYHGGADNNASRPLDYPARGPIPAFITSNTALQRSPSGGLSRGASPYADPRQTQQPQRVVVRSSEARDFLVPSVEPLSPSSGQRPAGPVFVRTVSPRQASRPPRGHVDEVRTQFDTRNSPSWSGESGTLKRRRVVDDESYPHRDPPRQEPVPMRRLVSDGWQRPLVHYAVARPNDVSPHIPTDRGSRTHFAHRPAQPIAGTPMSAPDGRSYYESPRFQPPLGSERAPIVLDDSDKDHPPAAATFPVRDYRGNVISERQEPSYRVAEAREDIARYAPVVEYRQPVPTGYSSAPDPRDLPLYIENQPPRPQDAIPIRLGPSLIDRPGAYDQQPAFANPPEVRPAVYNPPTYEAAPSQFQHQGSYEPAPVFVRPVERHDQPPLVEAREQPGWQYNPGPPHGYQAPRPAEGTWVQYVFSHRRPLFRIV